MKRLAIRLVLFLLLGAIVNIAVAWGLAFVAIRYWIPRPSGGEKGVHACWLGFRQQEVGLLRVTSKWSRGSDPRVEATWGIARNELIPGWAWEHTSIVVEDSSRTMDELSWQARGWPSVALYSHWHAWSEDGRTMKYESHCGLAPSWIQSITATTTARVFPLRPIWPGFAINTIFYAAVLWLLFATPGFVRRRIRRFRGRCLHCGYDLRGQPPDSTKCPECGNMVVVKCMGLPPPATPAPETERATT